MRKIAVIVEGPSDEIFWEKVLNREFAQVCRFKVLNQKGRSKVIESAPVFLDACRRGGYSSIFFLLDLDDSPCVAEVRELFDERIRAQAECSGQRFVHISIARKEFEGWLLADDQAVRAVLPTTQYVCRGATDDVGAEGILTDLLRQDRGVGVGFRKPAFAREIAPYFSPDRASKWSQSFAYFWKKICAAVAVPDP